MIENGYWILPNSILFSQELSDKQKLLYCFLSSLCAEKWYCWASNKYIGDRLWVNATTISTNINILYKLWYIDIEEWENQKRKCLLKNQKGVFEKSKGEPFEKSKDNNIIIKKQDNILVSKDTNTSYWNNQINELVELVKGFNNWLVDWTVQEQRRYWKLLLQKLELIPSVKDKTHKWLDILKIILKIISENSFHCHKIVSIKQIYYNLAWLMQVCKQESIKQNKWKIETF